MALIKARATRKDLSSTPVVSTRINPENHALTPLASLRGRAATRKDSSDIHPSLLLRIQDYFEEFFLRIKSFIGRKFSGRKMDVTIKVKFNNTLNKVHEISCTRDLKVDEAEVRTLPGRKFPKHTSLNRETRMDAKIMEKSKLPFIEDTSIIDLFTKPGTTHNIGRKRKLTHVAEKIQDRWVIQQLDEGKGASACFGMFVMDANLKKNPFKYLYREMSLNEVQKKLSKLKLRSEVKYWDQSIQNFESCVKANLNKRGIDEWKSMMVHLEPDGRKKYYVILDLYDSVTGALYLRDPYHGRSLSMNFDDFLKLKPSNVFLVVSKRVDKYTERVT